VTVSTTRTIASTKVAWRVEDKGGFESPFGGRGERWWWSEGKKKRERGGVYIGRGNMLVFVCGLVRKPLGRVANSCDLNLETIRSLEEWEEKPTR